MPPLCSSHPLVGLLLLLANVPLLAAPASYTLDPVHSRIAFAVDHDGYSTALGTFAQPTGTLWFDPQDWRGARVDVKLDLATLDLGDADLNARILRGDYLNRGKHPQARFVSNSVEPLTETTARVHGSLSLRGITLPITLDVTLNRLARSAWSLRRTVGFSATAILHRSAFGMTAHRRAVGDEVQLRIEVEAVRARQRRQPEPEDQAVPINPAPSPAESSGAPRP